MEPLYLHLLHCRQVLYHETPGEAPSSTIPPEKSPQPALIIKGRLITSSPKPCASEEASPLWPGLACLAMGLPCTPCVKMEYERCSLSPVKVEVVFLWNLSHLCVAYSNYSCFASMRGASQGIRLTPQGWISRRMERTWVLGCAIRAWTYLILEPACLLV